MSKAGDSPQGHVVMIVGQLRPIVGGAETQARRLACELQRRGAKVELWTGRWRSEWPRVDSLDGVSVRRLGRGFGSPFVKLGRYSFMGVLLWELWRRRSQLDLIHVHQVLYPAFVGAVAGRLLGKPSVARISSTGSTSDLVLSARGGVGFQRAITRRLLSRVVAVNAQAEADCLAAGYRREQVVRIPNGVPVPEQVRERDPREPLRVLYLGGLRREKRLEVLLEAWRRAKCEGVLRIVGSGPEHARLEDLSRPLGTSVELGGQVEDPTEELSQAEVFVLASDAEGMSNALLEAMSAGCACIATYVGGNIDALGPEISAPPEPGTYVEASAGILVRVGDTAGLATALAAACRSASLRRALGKAARRRCGEAFDISRVAAEYQELYRSLWAEQSD